MSLLDRIRRRAEAPTEPSPVPFFAASRGSGSTVTAPSATPARAERAISPPPDRAHGAAPAGFSGPLPPVDPQPVYVIEAGLGADRPAFMGPAPDDILQTSSGPHPSHPPLVTVYDHQALLAGNAAAKQIGRGPKPGGVS